MTKQASTWWLLSIAVVFAVAMIGADWITAKPDRKLLREEGAIGNMSMVLQVYAARCWLILNPPALWSRFRHLHNELTPMAGRELDVDFASTAPGILASAL